MNTREDLINNMENIVKENVKEFQSDFYNYDLNSLQTLRNGKYFWQVRRSGTWMLKNSRDNKNVIQSRIDFYKEQCPSQNAKSYLIDLKSNTISKWNEF